MTRTFGLLQTAEAQTLAGFLEDARGSFALALNVALRAAKQAETETDWSRSSAAHTLQAVAQAEIGDFAEALEQLVMERWMSSALKSIALAQLHGGDVQGAVRTANFERSGRLALLRSVAEVPAGCRRQGKLQAFAIMLRGRNQGRQRKVRFAFADLSAAVAALGEAGVRAGRGN